MSKTIFTGKNEVGIIKLNENRFKDPDEDVLALSVSEDEFEQIMLIVSRWAWDTYQIDIDECEFGEILNEQIDAFLEKIGDDKDEVPCLYEALTTAKRVGGSVEICF